MAKTNCISRFGYNENIADQQSIKCPCGKVGRFVMDKRVGDLKYSHFLNTLSYSYTSLALTFWICHRVFTFSLSQYCIQSKHNFKSPTLLSITNLPTLPQGYLIDC